MAVGVVTGQSRGHVLQWEFREYRDAVEGLLPVHCNIVAQRLERLARKGFVDALGLLQEDDVGPPLR